MTKHKCVFNRRSAQYGLRIPSANVSRLDWKATPYIPSSGELIDRYVFDLDSNPKIDF